MHFCFWQVFSQFASISVTMEILHPADLTLANVVERARRGRCAVGHSLKAMFLADHAHKESIMKLCQQDLGRNITTIAMDACRFGARPW